MAKRNTAICADCGVDRREVPLVNRAEAARMLGMRPKTLANWKCDKAQPGLRVVDLGGGTIRYCPGCLEVFITTRTRSA